MIKSSMLPIVTKGYSNYLKKNRNQQSFIVVQSSFLSVSKRSKKSVCKSEIDLNSKYLSV